MIITFSKSWLFLLLLNYNQYIIIINYSIRKIWPWLKGAMSRIARLLSHHSSGAKYSLVRQKYLLIKRVNRGLPAPCRFPPRFDMKLSSSWEVRVRNYRPDNKEPIRKQKNCPRSLPRRFSLISDSESKIKKYARLGNHADRDNPFKPRWHPSGSGSGLKPSCFI